MGTMGKSPAACMLETYAFERLCSMEPVGLRRLGPLKNGKHHLQMMLDSWSGKLGVASIQHSFLSPQSMTVLATMCGMHHTRSWQQSHVCQCCAVNILYTILNSRRCPSLANQRAWQFSGVILSLVPLPIMARLHIISLARQTAWEGRRCSISHRCMGRQYYSVFPRLSDLEIHTHKRDVAGRNHCKLLQKHLDWSPRFSMNLSLTSLQQNQETHWLDCCRETGENVIEGL